MKRTEADGERCRNCFFEVVGTATGAQSAGNEVGMSIVCWFGAAVTGRKESRGQGIHESIMLV